MIFLVKITSFTIYSDLIWRLTVLAYTDIVAEFYLPIDIGTLHTIDLFHQNHLAFRVLTFCAGIYEKLTIFQYIGI